MKKITVKVDHGYKETFAKWNGKFLDETAYDEVIKVTNEDMGIMKPVTPLDGSDVPLAYVITNAYPKEIATRASQGMPYPRRSPLGYHGGFTYMRLMYSF